MSEDSTLNVPGASAYSLVNPSISKITGERFLSINLLAYDFIICCDFANPLNKFSIYLSWSLGQGTAGIPTFYLA